MLSGLLVIFIILVCIGLIGVVLLQRSEGGAFGMGGGPGGLITTRGAGDLLTRTTWILFALFLLLSLGLTLLDAHDHASSSLLQQMKSEIANPNALNQQPANSVAPGAPAPGAPAQAPAQFVPPSPIAPQSGASLQIPAAPGASPAQPAQTAPAKAEPAKAAKPAKAAQAAPAAPAAPAPSLDIPPAPAAPAPSPAPAGAP
jgi:preprotein translocase subunit SecG